MAHGLWQRRTARKRNVPGHFSNCTSAGENPPCGLVADPAQAFRADSCIWRWGHCSLVFPGVE